VPKYSRQWWYEVPKDSGFRFGFIGMFLVAITAIFLSMVGIGEWTQTLQAFTNILILGLVLTIFMSAVYRDMTKTKTQKQDMLVLGAESTYKQMVIVLPAGIMLGIFAVMLNGLTMKSGNLLFESILGSISGQVFVLALLAGVAEELFFRGFLQSFIELAFGATRLARFVAIIPVAIVFSMFHYSAVNTAAAYLALFIIGCVFGLAHALSNDIGVPMLAHITNNCFALLPLVGAAVFGNLVLIVVVAMIFFAAFIVGSMRRRK
jgi:membrane protease YdiL (CAAX protease family)